MASKASSSFALTRYRPITNRPRPSGGVASLASETTNLVVKKKSSRKRKPALTVDCEMLRAEKGLKYVFDSFPKTRFQGSGHEVSDLRRLLALYEEWAFRLRPTLALDDFLHRVEALSGTRPLAQLLLDVRHGTGSVPQGDMEADECLLKEARTIRREIERDLDAEDPPSTALQDDDETSVLVFHADDLDDLISRTPHERESAPSSVSAEDLARIEQNRQRALEIRRRKEMERSMAPEPSSSGPSQEPSEPASTTSPTITQVEAVGEEDDRPMTPSPPEEQEPLEDEDDQDEDEKEE